MTTPDKLVQVSGVSKKFCRSLKRSLWYSALDIGAEITGRQGCGDLRTDEFWAVQNISFTLRRGECLALIGHNGAGKSTLLKLLNGIIKPDRGRIETRGRVGAMIELGAGFDPILTGRENIYNRGVLLGFTHREIDRRFDEIVEFAELEAFLDMPVRNYSSGMKVRLGFAVSAQMDPDVLLIDEVLAVGDIGFRLKCLNAMSRLVTRTATIIVSHSMPQVAQIATRGMHLHKGFVRCASHNVASVIDDYFSRFDADAYRESGSGKASLRNLSISSAGQSPTAGDDTLRIDHGDTLQIDLGLSFVDTIRTAKLRLVFFTQEMRPVAECHSILADFVVRNESPTNPVRITIPNLPFNSGLHSLAVIVLEPEPNREECYLRVDNAATFQVRTFVSCWADSILPAQWMQQGSLSSEETLQDRPPELCT